MRLIDAMYHFYGKSSGRCANCPHFVKRIFDKTYYKCSVYGTSHSDATDCRCKWTACGLIDKPFPENDKRIVDVLKHMREIDIPIEGQMKIDI